MFLQRSFTVSFTIALVLAAPKPFDFQKWHHTIPKWQEETTQNTKDINLSVHQIQFQEDFGNYFRFSEEELRKIERDIDEFYNNFELRPHPGYKLTFSRHPEYLPFPWELPMTPKNNNARPDKGKQSPTNKGNANKPSKQSPRTEKPTQNNWKNPDLFSTTEVSKQTLVTESSVPSTQRNIPEKITLSDLDNPNERFSTAEDSKQTIVTESSTSSTQRIVPEKTTISNFENTDQRFSTTGVSKETIVTESSIPSTQRKVTENPTLSNFDNQDQQSTTLTSEIPTTRVNPEELETTKPPIRTTKAPKSRVFDFIIS